MIAKTIETTTQYSGLLMMARLNTFCWKETFCRIKSNMVSIQLRKDFSMAMSWQYQDSPYG